MLYALVMFMNNAVLNHYGDLRPGDMVLGSERGMMVISTVKVDTTAVEVRWMKLWGYDGALFEKGPLRDRVYAVTSHTPHGWKLIRPSVAS